MPRCVEWLRSLPGKPVFVGYPVRFDFSFVYLYLIHFTGESPFSQSAAQSVCVELSVTFWAQPPFGVTMVTEPESVKFISQSNCLDTQVTQDFVNGIS